MNEFLWGLFSGLISVLFALAGLAVILGLAIFLGLLLPFHLADSGRGAHSTGAGLKRKIGRFVA